MLRHFLATSAILAAIFALLIAGCGGDDDSTGGAGNTSAGSASNGAEDGNDASAGGASREPITVKTGSLTKAQFVKQANAICLKSAEAVQNRVFEFTQNSQATQRVQAAEAAEIAIPLFERQIDQISDLGAPKGDEDKVASILNAMQQDLENGEARPLKFFGEDPFATAARQAKAYGLGLCIP